MISLAVDIEIYHVRTTTLCKNQPFQTSGRKIHSNRNILHKHFEGAVWSIQIVQYKNIVNNSCKTQMQSSKNSAFFTVLLVGEHFGQRI